MMIIVNSRLLHQLHSLSVAHTHTLFFTPRIHVYGGRLFGKELHPVFIIYMQSFTLDVKDTVLSVSLCLSAADFIFLFL